MAGGFIVGFFGPFLAGGAADAWDSGPAADEGPNEGGAPMPEPSPDGGPPPSDAPVCSDNDNDDERPRDCEAQFQNDLSTCRALGRRSKKRGALCYASAIERKNACLDGRPLPPLHGWW